MTATPLRRTRHRGAICCPHRRCAAPADLAVHWLALDPTGRFLVDAHYCDRCQPRDIAIAEGPACRRCGDTVLLVGDLAAPADAPGPDPHRALLTTWLHHHGWAAGHGFDDVVCPHCTAGDNLLPERS